MGTPSGRDAHAWDSCVWLPALEGRGENPSAAAKRLPSFRSSTGFGQLRATGCWTTRCTCLLSFWPVRIGNDRDCWLGGRMTQRMSGGAAYLSEIAVPRVAPPFSCRRSSSQLASFDSRRGPAGRKPPRLDAVHLRQSFMRSPRQRLAKVALDNSHSRCYYLSATCHHVAAHVARALAVRVRDCRKDRPGLVATLAGA